MDALRTGESVGICVRCYKRYVFEVKRIIAYIRESIRCVTSDRFACIRRDAKLHMCTTPKLDEHKLLKQVRQDRKEMG